MSEQNLSKKSIVAIIIGNALEWYDFVIYSFMTVYIAKLFFPQIDGTNALLATTAMFGVAFFMRPLGGLVSGWYADTYGRKAAMLLVLGLMTIAILMISFAPTYASVGLIAPLVILIARLLQGFSAGGEFATSTTMLIELSPSNQRGFYGSFQMAGQMLAMLFGSLVGLTLTNYLSVETIEAWGWRLPFLVGLIIAPVGLYIRQQMGETKIDKHIKTLAEKREWVNELKAQWRHILIVMGLVVGGTVSTYTNISYLPTFVDVYLHVTIQHAFVALFLGMTMMVCLIPLFGSLSDRIGRKNILLVAVLSYLIVVYPLFYWVSKAPSLFSIVTLEIITCFFLSAYFAVFPAMIAEVFPKTIRTTSLAISYNLAVMLFGGFAQFIVTKLITITENPLAITYYLIFAMLLTLVAGIFYQESEYGHA